LFLSEGIVLMSEPEWLADGYAKWEGHDPFEDHCGPMFFKERADGSFHCLLQTTEKHRNGSGAIHGGALMTYADYAVFVFARKALEGISAVTVTMNCEFTAAGEPGEVLEATGEVVRETGGMVFVRGTITTGDRVLLNYSSVLKKIRPRG